MSELNTLDLKGLVVNALGGVFDTMLSMDIVFQKELTEGLGNGNRIVGSVSFAGAIMGSVNIHVTDAFAREITAAMLGMEVDEIEEEEEVLDVIGEVSNMVGGDLKSKFCDSGFPCELSIPTTTSGSNFKIESLGWDKSERLGFQSQNNMIYVELAVKSGS